MTGIVSPSVASAPVGGNPLFDNKLVWMNSADAAFYLRRTPNALRIAVHRGELRARKWRARLYFKKIDLDLMVETSP